MYNLKNCIKINENYYNHLVVKIDLEYFYNNIDDVKINYFYNYNLREFVIDEIWEFISKRERDGAIFYCFKPKSSNPKILNLEVKENQIQFLIKEILYFENCFNDNGLKRNKMIFILIMFFICLFCLFCLDIFLNSYFFKISVIFIFIYLVRRIYFEN